MELNNENPPIADNQVPVVPDNNVQDQDLPIVNIRPTDPIMGIFAEQHPPGSGKWNARMGGKPNSEWTGLQPYQVFKSTPFHYRRTEMTADSKGFLVRSTGQSTKFKLRMMFFSYSTMFGNILLLMDLIQSHIFVTQQTRPR